MLAKFLSSFLACDLLRLKGKTEQVGFVLTNFDAELLRRPNSRSRECGAVARSIRILWNMQGRKHVTDPLREGELLRIQKLRTRENCAESLSSSRCRCSPRASSTTRRCSHEIDASRGGDISRGASACNCENSSAEIEVRY